MKEIINIRARISTENRKTTVKIDESKSLQHQQIDKTLIRISRRMNI